MLKASLGLNGGITAPHRAAALAGRDVLVAGGTAIEAMVAAAATIAVVYPHMNGIGGDGFWIIHREGHDPVGISACGTAAGMATPEFYATHGHTEAIPARGGLAALTVPGTISGWQAALSLVPQDRRLPLSVLLADAIMHARDGIAVTGNQSDCTREKLNGLKNVPGFAETYLIEGKVPAAGDRLVQGALGRTLQTLADNGLEAFYSGPVAETHAAFLQEHGSPLRIDDFNSYAAQHVMPLSLKTSHGRLFNMIAPTQGVSSLGILGVFDRLGVLDGESFNHIHGLIEATKQTFIRRNADLGDPKRMQTPAQEWLRNDVLGEMTARIDPFRALDWPHIPKAGDTIWMGASDSEGTVVSFIQSVFWEFGSGLTCPETGVFFQNRGAGFSLQPGPNELGPGRCPFHTLNPALALLNDGRVMSYGTMGGEGQPQTQAAVFSRHVQFGMDLQAAVTAPRWLLGRTWGDETTSLKIESRFDERLVDALRGAGHEIEMLPEFSDLTGHAGALVRHPDGLVETATDPRADGAALSI
ncbi:gamma-glutamyltransferase family protein [Sulfitobacter guttiformis]|uniref:Gamma-glutamyltranspeptidase/glutathione hydrolase n=1 Tax=Sulfitobacter guttiformis TaxID=74349 RepID=A0A420DTL6_9RHOB|nr:gamma-glutamyltransferase [Sulfitobacter guttiformis]KIN71005.1 Gamma-glutamyltranspeptidase [Sulfitobacter guttiformis KCTC 32187]RKE97489.1 gamma-glutamyltranspeptidase/glutathione hydrolase [Sulfitobacter guttiformis]